MTTINTDALASHIAQMHASASLKRNATREVTMIAVEDLARSIAADLYSTHDAEAARRFLERAVVDFPITKSYLNALTSMQQATRREQEVIES